MLANRIWQHHFGTGLAATSDNLGYTGSPPTHPELLEWLASELVRSGWSAKALHRLIVTSRVYRQSSSPRPDASSIDPDNRLLSRYPLRRLDAEAMRDAILAITGELADRQGGPYVPTHRDESGEVVVVGIARRRKPAARFISSSGGRRLPACSNCSTPPRSSRLALAACHRRSRCNRSA